MEHEIDSPALHFGGQAMTQIVVEAAQDLRPAIELGHLAAQAIEDAGEFHRDVAAAENSDALGQFSQLESLVGGDAVFRSESSGPHGMGAIGNQDLVRADPL